MASHQVVMSKGERKCRLVFLKQLLLFLGWPGVKDQDSVCDQIDDSA